MKDQVDLAAWFMSLILVSVFVSMFVGACSTSRQSPAKLSTQDRAVLNLSDELDRALARGDRVRKMPHGDYAWDWCKPGETWDFQRWHYEIVRP